MWLRNAVQQQHSPVLEGVFFFFLSVSDFCSPKSDNYKTPLRLESNAVNVKL